MKKIFVFVFAALLAVGLANAQTPEELEKSTKIKPRMTVPAFKVDMLDGGVWNIEELRGKVVLINFWATWCPPCQQELARVQTDLIDRFKGRDFVFLPISRGEKTERVKAFMDKKGYTFPTGLDTDQKIFGMFAETYIPRTFLINSDGTVYSYAVGYEPEEFDALLVEIEKLLSK